MNGFDISPLAGALAAVILTYFPRRAAAPIVIGLLACYVALVGADPSVVRAAIMASLTLLAPLTGLAASGFRKRHLWFACMLPHQVTIIPHSSALRSLPPGISHIVCADRALPGVRADCVCLTRLTARKCARVARAARVCGTSIVGRGLAPPLQKYTDSFGIYSISQD